MAENKTPAASEELDDLAFRIFSQRATSGRRSGEREALNAYNQARAFLAVKEKLRSGKLKEPEASPLAECCAPNLDRNHPINLVAQTFTDRRGGKPVPGDLAKVKRIKQWLDQHMTPDVNPDELAAKLAADFPELKWDLPTINVARAVLPAYVNN